MRLRRGLHRLISAVFAGLLSTAVLSAVSLEELAGPDRAALLLTRGSLSAVQQKDPRPSLVPLYPAVRSLIDAVIGELDPSVFVESLYLYKKPAFASPAGWSETERTALYNEILALSTLAGVQYFSASRGSMRTFYETSSVIDGPGTKRPVGDPRYAFPPAETTIYARQKDLSFGDNIYRYAYYARPDSLVFMQENLTTMNYGIIPVVGKNKLRSVVAVIDAGEHLLIYAASMVKSVSIPGMSQRVSASFSTRADAIMGWFSSRADRAFRAANP
ncbi:MAG: hypothetical protein LBP74_01530 [Treponema sp.]|jgi:hypothetical protein|nr:hypothetical protein [Treponema sp.]